MLYFSLQKGLHPRKSCGIIEKTEKPIFRAKGVRGVEAEQQKQSYKIRVRENLGLMLYNCGFQQCPPGYAWGPAVRDHHLIHFVTSGHGVLSFGGKQYAVSPGDAFYCAPNCTVHYCADLTDPWEYYWVGFNGTEAERLMHLTCLSSEHPVEHFDDSELLRSCILEITKSVGTAPYQEARMIGGLYQFLSVLMERANRTATGSSASQYVDKAMQYIQYNYSRSIDVTDIAAHVGVSRSHLYRVFVKHLGISPNDFLIRFRINEACSLLRKRSLSIGEISFSVGFADQLYFSRQFKKIKGVSPSKYLESLGTDG